MVTMTTFTTTDTNIPVICFNGNSTSQRYGGHAKSRLTLKNVAVPLQLCVVRPRDGHRAIGIGCPSATWRTISPARHEASIAHANDHAEQLRGRSRLPGSGRAPTSCWHMPPAHSHVVCMHSYCWSYWTSSISYCWTCLPFSYGDQLPSRYIVYVVQY